MVLVPAEFWVVVLGLLGAIIGSYVNMAAYRLPRNISTVTRSRSFCPQCQHQLAWYDNLPILSYLLLLGRCRYCRKPIPVRYLLVELLVSFLFVMAAWQFLLLNHALFWYAYADRFSVPPVILCAQLFLIADLVLLSVVDIETWLIPPATTMPGIVLGLIIAPLFPDLHPSASAWFAGCPRLNALLDSFQGLVLGAGLPWSINILTMAGSLAWYKLKGRKSRPLEGMGAGDSHLLGMVGALLGWKPALATLLLGIFVGCAVGISKILWDRFQHWRLGDRWTPWQPTFDMPPETDGKPQAPAFWPLLAMGAVVLLAVVLLFEQSGRTFDGRMFRTAEEMQPGAFLPRGLAERQRFDVRVVPVWIMLGIGLLQVAGYIFLKYLAASDNLPQGSIVETAKGEKQEVMQGNYIPFGPSLAAGALVVTFYDPLIRSFTYWWLIAAGAGPLPLPAYRLLGQDTIIPLLMRWVHWLDAVSTRLLGG